MGHVDARIQREISERRTSACEGRVRKFMSIVIERECRGVDIHCTEKKAVTAIVKELQVTL